MKAIVHIGTEKTGTTTIQEFLFQNQKKLARKGFRFLQSAGDRNNRAVVAYCMKDAKFDDFFKQKGISTQEQKTEFRQDYLRQFCEELETLPRKTHTVIISSEHFHSRIVSKEETDRVRDFLAPYFSDIEILCYVRNQIDTLGSFYSTAIKSGSSEAFDSFAARCAPGNIYYNHAKMLSNWEASFGRSAMNVALFEREAFLKGDLLEDFISHVDPTLTGKLDGNIQSQNESLNFTGQLLGKAVNKVLPVYNEDGSVNELRPLCQEIIYEECRGKGQQPAPEMQQRIFEDFSESNEQVRQKYFPEREALFSPPTFDEHINEINETQFANALVRVLALFEERGFSEGVAKLRAVSA